MKKYRKQMVYLEGQRHLVDVPVDDELYKSDNHDEYQRVRSNLKHVALEDAILADTTVDVTEAFEEKQLLKCLHIALEQLTEKELQLVKNFYYSELTEREVAEILGVSHQAVGKQKRRIIQKLKNILKEWQ